jgi:predicted nuclease of predicted toxin-antitoxin system
MKLLVDQNLPPKLVPRLEAQFPGSVHVNEAGLGGATDISLWRFAALNGLDIISRDEDLAYLAVRRVEDVCVVWVRLGNLALRRLLDEIVRQLPSIASALGARSCRVIELR